MNKEAKIFLGRFLGFYVPLPVLAYFSLLSLPVLVGSVSEIIKDPKLIVFPITILLWLSSGWIGIITIYVVSGAGYRIEGKSWAGIIVGICAAIPFLFLGESIWITLPIFCPVCVTLVALYETWRKNYLSAQPVAGGDATR